MNKLAVVISTPPHSNLTTSAINYVETALSMGIEVVGVFFYQDGVTHGNANIEIASDEFQAIQHWERLANTYQLPLHLCATAAQKRGINCHEATTTTEQSSNHHTLFTVSGLGELVELSNAADKLIQF